MKKKILALFVVVFAAVLVVTGCGEKTESKDLSALSVSEIKEEVFKGIKEGSDIPNLVEIELTEENMSYYIGVESLDIKEAYAYEPMMGSIAFSVAIIKVNDGVDIASAKTAIKNNVDPAKWICVEADEVSVDSKDNVIILVMTSSISHPGISTKITNNFKNM